MADISIVDPTTAAAPKDYPFSGTQELALKTVRALIDGSGAASAFLPTLQLLDPNGNVAWEGATTNTVAAGGSADVSWFPGLGASSSGTSGGVQWCFARRVTNFSVGSAQLLRIPWTHFVTSDPTVFTNTTHTNPNDQINGLQPGVYIAAGTQVWAAPQNYKHFAQITTDFFGIAPTVATPTSDSVTDQTEAGRSRSVGDTMICLTQSTPGEISLQAGNNDGVAHNVVLALYAIAYWPNAVLAS